MFSREECKLGAELVATLIQHDMDKSAIWGFTYLQNRLLLNIVIHIIHSKFRFSKVTLWTFDKVK